MTINRHNYETFFLLYTDDELSVTEKRAVDEFVQTNPDLQEELVMLQQSVLKPENIVFGEKGGLIKNEIDPTRLQEKLLMFLDHELTTTDKNEIEELIKSDADVKKEWTILQQTKLLPGKKVVFEDKRSLYKKEAGRLVAFNWRSVAVAAVLIGFGVWGGLLYFNNETNTPAGELAKNKPSKTSKERVMQPAPETSARVVTSASNEEIAVEPLTVHELPKEKRIAIPGKITRKKLVKPDFKTIVVNEKANLLPKPGFDNANIAESNKTNTAFVPPGKQPGNSNNSVDTGIKNNGQEEVSRGYATAASFNNNTEANNNRILFMDEEKIKKTRLGGIFRKVKRVIERTANISTGTNNIKVANLEFAFQ